MDKLEKLLKLFSETYPQLKNVIISTIPYNNNYIGLCLGDRVGDYIYVKKARLLTIIPKEIVLTDICMNKKEEELIFVFIHECTHGITPHTERKVKNKYIRIDHPRQFYINFFLLLKIAHKNNYIKYNPSSIKELMKKDNRKENIENDLRLYGKYKQ